MKNDNVLLTNGLYRKTEETQELYEQENDSEQGFKLIRRRLQNAWILFCKNTITFRDLGLPGGFVYSSDGRKCEEDDKFDLGMHVIRYTGRLLGGVRHFVDRMFGCFAIFSSIDKSFDIVKVDLVGYEIDNEKQPMEKWILRAAGMYTECKVKILEVEAPKECDIRKNYWLDI
jgi:hypothetical protein